MTEMPTNAAPSIKSLLIRLAVLSRPSFIFLFISLASVQSLALSNVSFKRIIPEEVEVLGHINTIQQDSTGFMWFAGEKGLARFDGYKVRIFRTDSGEKSPIAANYITDLYLDENGKLWISSRVGLHLYNEDSDSFENYRTDSVSSRYGIGYVNSITSKKDGLLWLAANGGVFTFNKRNKTFSATPIDQSVQQEKASTAWDLTFDHNERLWVAYERLGVRAFDLESGVVLRYEHDPFTVSTISSNNVREIYVDSRNQVWIGTYGRGLNLLKDNRDDVIRFPHANSEKSGVIWSVLEDQSGRYWVGDGESVSLLDVESREFTRFTHAEEKPASPGNYVANIVYEDRAGNIWIGYFPSGVDIVDAQASVFNNLRHRSTNPNSIADGGVLSTFQDKSGNLWVGAGLGLSYINRDTGKIKNINHIEGDQSTPSGNTVLSVIEDSQGLVWLGIWNAGLNLYDPELQTFKYFLPQESDETSIVGREPWDVIEDSRGDIWVATEKGVAKFHRDKNRFTRYVPPNHMLGGSDSFYCRKAYEDKSQRLWFGCASGLYLLDRDSGLFTHYVHQEADSTSISDSYVISIFEDSKGRFWVGTSNGGLNLMNRATGSFTSLTMDDGLPNNTVAGIIEDVSGMIWLATNKGLAQLNPETKTFRNYDRRHGLIDNLFNRDSLTLTSEGELVAGSSKGMTMFKPERLQRNGFEPPIVITDFKVFNESQTINNSKVEVLDRNIIYAKEINLEFWQSVFSFEFAALNFVSPDDNLYKYRLLGFEENWRADAGSRVATYTNIDPGRYTFQVLGSNNEGVWNENAASINVIISPPFWKTWWAYAMYACAAVLVIFLLVSYYLRKIAFDKQKFVNTQLLEMDKLKDEFLASTSHELRTPLNGMIGLSDSLVSEYSRSGDQKLLEKLNIISTSGKRLSHLINDILDYSKIKDSRLELNILPVSIDDVVESVFSLLNPIASSKGISLAYQALGVKCYVQADENRLQQILINLVGNAIKYSDKGTITVSCERLSSSLRVVVLDEGIGIPEEKLSTIFETFRQLEFSKEHNVGGTGLGLSITKKLVELHGGVLKVRSSVGKGSEFEFSLPLNLDVVVSQSNTSITAKQNSLTVKSASPVPAVKKPASISEKSPSGKVLVVDDDPVNRMIVLGYLENNGIEVLECENGYKAIEFVKQDDSIRLIVMDNMMPGITGIEACQEIRKTYSSEQLPIFLLSAVKRDEEVEKCFSVGVNDFFQKPVSPNELIAKVKYHLNLSSINVA